MEEIQLCGKVNITCVENLETGNLELLVNWDDPNGMPKTFWCKEAELGNFKFIPIKIGG